MIDVEEVKCGAAHSFLSMVRSADPLKKAEKVIKFWFQTGRTE